MCGQELVDFQKGCIHVDSALNEYTSLLDMSLLGGMKGSEAEQITTALICQAKKSDVANTTDFSNS